MQSPRGHRGAREGVHVTDTGRHRVPGRVPGCRRQPGSRLGLRVFLLVLLAAVGLPCLGGLEAAHLARSVTLRRDVAGQQAIADEVAQQVDERYGERGAVVDAAALRPRTAEAFATAGRPDLVTRDLAELSPSGWYCSIRLVRAAGGPELASWAPAVPRDGCPAGAVRHGPEGVPQVEGAAVTVGVASDVRDPDGHTLGRLEASFPVAGLLSGRRQLSVGVAGRLTLVGADGVIYLSATRSFQGTPLAAPQLLALVRSGRTGATTYWSPRLHEHYLGVYRPLPGRRLGIAVSVPLREAFASADHLAAQLRLGLAVLAAAGLALAAGVARHVMRDERRLADRREFVDAVLESMDTPVVACDAAGRYSYFNRASRLLLADSDQVRGGKAPPPRGALLLGAAGQRLPVADLPLARALRDGQVHDAEVVFVAPDGRRRTLVINGRALRAADGRVLGAVTAAHDITAQREREQSARTRALDLEAIAGASRAMVGSDDARPHLCASVREVAEAVHVALLEPDASGCLVVTAAAGPPVPIVVDLADLDATSAEVFRTGAPALLDGLAARENPGAQAAVAAGAVSGVWFPVAGDDGSLGVLVTLLPHPVAELRVSAFDTMQVLADTTAVALQRARLAERLARQARTDALTGLANRRVWDESAPLELERARRTGTPVSLAVLDLDNFKQFNDARGHQAGDALLRTAAAAWSAALRTTDLLARYGGEEFTVALPGCALPDAVTLLDALRVLLPDGATASVGVAEWNGHERFEAVLARADAALYAAKRAGRDQVVAAPPTPPPTPPPTRPVPALPLTATEGVR